MEYVGKITNPVARLKQYIRESISRHMQKQTSTMLSPPFHSSNLDASDSSYIDVAEFKGQSFAVDLSIWLNKHTRKDIGKLAQTSIPTYPDPDLVPKLKQIHYSLSEHINLVYVYDGIAPPHKNSTKEDRRRRRERAGQKWTSLCAALQQDPNKIIEQAELSSAIASQMDMNHPSAIDHANVLQWMIDDGIKCYGSIAEMRYQSEHSQHYALSTG